MNAASANGLARAVMTMACPAPTAPAERDIRCLEAAPDATVATAGPRDVALSHVALYAREHRWKQEEIRQRRIELRATAGGDHVCRFIPGAPITIPTAVRDCIE